MLEPSGNLWGGMRDGIIRTASLETCWTELYGHDKSSIPSVDRWMTHGNHIT